LQSLDADAKDGCAFATSSGRAFNIALYGRLTEYGKNEPLPCEESGPGLIAEIHGEARPMAGMPASFKKLILRNGAAGWFRPVSCSASCGPATLHWQTAEASYWIQMRFPSNTPGAKQQQEMLETVNTLILLPRRK
jgi:hypothetical protein